ncbi:MAG: porin family protein [Deltaproteobacteria bacterium]|nr:porin family protein [Deltaproteobacteria bacterium]
MLQIGGFRPWRLALGVVLGLAFASASQAQDFARKGGYAVVGGNYMLEQFTNPGRFSFGDSWGLNLRLGYRYLPWLSSELEWEFISGFDINDGQDADGNPIERGDLKIDGGNISLNTKAYLMPGRIQPYVLLGVGALYASVTNFGYELSWLRNVNGVSFSVRGGVGLNVYLGHRWGLTAGVSYVFPVGNLDNLRYLSADAGFEYRF